MQKVSSTSPIDAMPFTGSTNATDRSLLAALIGQYAVRDGKTPSPLQGVHFFRSSQPTDLTAIVCDPSVILVAQGQKQVYLAGREYTYDVQHYLVLSVPLPVHAQVRTATPEAPYLSLSITIDPAELSALILEMDDASQRHVALQSGISMSPLPTAFYDAAVRLLQAMENPSDARVLGPLCMREILYRALRGPQGSLLRAIALRHGRHHRIARVLNLIHTNLDASLDVPMLAEAAEMSVSTFHHTFKAVTSLAPIQYVKTIRLHKARSLLFYDGLTVGEVAYRVGYRSASQFSREFRRLFGLPPTEEIARLKATGELINNEMEPVFMPGVPK